MKKFSIFNHNGNDHIKAEHYLDGNGAGEWMEVQPSMIFSKERTVLLNYGQSDYIYHLHESITGLHTILRSSN